MKISGYTAIVIVSWLYSLGHIGWITGITIFLLFLPCQYFIINLTSIIIAKMKIRAKVANTMNACTLLYP